MTEKLLTGTLSLDTTKNKRKVLLDPELSITELLLKEEEEREKNQAKTERRKFQAYRSNIFVPV